MLKGNVTSIWWVPLKTVLIYLIYSLAWVFFSDRLLAIIVSDPNNLQTDLQSIKEFTFICITALILYSFLIQVFGKITSTEKKLRKSESKWRSFLQNAPDIIIHMDRKGKILFTNQTLLTEGNNVSNTIYDITPKQHHVTLKENIEETFRCKTTQTCEIPITLLEGRIAWCEVQIAPIHSLENINEVICFARDISERKKTEKEISMLAHAIRSISESVVITDMENKIIFVNRAFTHTYGYEEKELLGESIKIIRSELTPSVGHKILPDTLKGGWQGELFNRKKDGSDFPISLSTSVVTDGIGQPLALIAVAQDITEKRHLEEEMRHSQKLQSLGTLAGGIAHDFNNLLTIIMGYASLIERGDIKPERFSWGLKSIIKAGERGSGLIQQILTFARKTHVLFETVKVNSAINDLVDMAKQTFPKKITFLLNLKKDLPFIKADHNQLHQALLNLCVNARDAMPNGGNIFITSKTILGSKLRKKFPDAKEDNYINITISDSGKGIDPITLKRVFEPFFTTKHQTKGTGLGLAVVYGIVSKHKGFIDIDSEEGKGTSIYSYFPVAENQTDTQNEDPKIDIYSKGGKETILLVEDEQMLLEMVNEILTKSGYSVILAKDGEEAVKLYSEKFKDIDLILTDFGLPNLDGWQAYLQMKEYSPDAKFILASGYLDPKIKEEMNEFHLGNFLKKPYRPTQILEKVRKVLDYSLN